MGCMWRGTSPLVGWAPSLPGPMRLGVWGNPKGRRPLALVLNLNNCYLVFALSINMIGLCLSQYGCSFKENNGYSVYFNNTFNGLTPKMNGLLNLDRSDTHVHAKR